MQCDVDVLHTHIYNQYYEYGYIMEISYGDRFIFIFYIYIPRQEMILGK